MAQIVEAAPVLRVCSCITARQELMPDVEAELVRAFGAIALESPAFPFDISGYYREEMGDDLRRIWFCFEKLCRPERLPSYRLATGRIEDGFAGGGKRRVNLDPGYLDHGKLVLASLKEAPEKTYMGEGVWAHTCLRFRSGEFTAPDHSFPDFRDGRFNDFMRQARALYKTLLHGNQPPYASIVP